MTKTPDFSDLSPSNDDFGPAAADRLIGWAIENAASDVHLLPTSKGLAISARICGRLNEIAILHEGGERLVARLKVMAHLLTYRSDRPQEGRLTYDHAPPTKTRATANLDSPTEVRLATCPTVAGEKAILRLFATRAQYSKVDDLGLPENVQSRWSSWLQASSGLVLITGPAGSGKTTTAYASLRSLQMNASSPKAIVTLEDPVEQVIDGIAQTPVAGTTGLTFAEGLRSTLRHDPDVIFVGELRDQDTVETAVRAALTGHFVIATLHSGSASEAVLRLFDANVPPFLILSALRGVLHQRLATTVSRVQQLLAELLDIDAPTVRDAIRDQAPSAQLEAAAALAGMQTIREAAKELLANGVLDHDEYTSLSKNRAS